jgi:hypothetical protein
MRLALINFVKSAQIKPNFSLRRNWRAAKTVSYLESKQHLGKLYDRSHYLSTDTHNLTNKFYTAKAGIVFRLVTLRHLKGYPGRELPFIKLSLWETQGLLREAWFTTDLYEPIRS